LNSQNDTIIQDLRGSYEDADYDVKFGVPGGI